MMSSLAQSLHRPSLPARIVGAWQAAAARRHPIAAIVVAWAVLTVPLVFFRGYNFDEGVAVSIARTALKDGHWLTPYMFNVRWVERPTLLSWLIAAVSAPFGSVTQITSRVTVDLFLLFGSLLIYWLLRKVAASVPAALFGVALFLACPLTIRFYVTVVADMPLAVLLFFAFTLWWSGNAEGSVSIGRWCAIGIVLALAGLFKGPEPLAYFALGVGVFVLGARAWRQIPGLVLAGLICALPLGLWYGLVYQPGDEATWVAFMRFPPKAPGSGPLTGLLRLVLDTLPATLMAAAYLIVPGVRGKSPAPPGFVAALACYAFIASLLVLFFRGGSSPRYFFPMVPPLCVIGALAYDALRERRPQIVAPILVLTAALLVYGLAYSAASPLLPLRFRQAQIDAERITALVRAEPAPIYRTGDVGLNVLPYVPGRILNASLDELAALSGPAWILLPTDQADALLARRPGSLRVVTPLGDVNQWRLLRLDG